VNTLSCSIFISFLLKKNKKVVALQSWANFFGALCTVAHNMINYWHDTVCL